MTCMTDPVTLKKLSGRGGQVEIIQDTDAIVKQHMDRLSPRSSTIQGGKEVNNKTGYIRYADSACCTA